MTYLNLTPVHWLALSERLCGCRGLCSRWRAISRGNFSAAYIWRLRIFIWIICEGSMTEMSLTDVGVNAAMSHSSCYILIILTFITESTIFQSTMITSETTMRIVRCSTAIIKLGPPTKFKTFIANMIITTWRRCWWRCWIATYFIAADVWRIRIFVT